MTIFFLISPDILNVINKCTSGSWTAQSPIKGPTWNFNYTKIKTICSSNPTSKSPRQWL